MRYLYEKNLKCYQGEYLNVCYVKDDAILIDFYVIFNDYQFADANLIVKDIIADCMNSKDFIQKNQFEMGDYIKTKLENNNIDFELVLAKWKLTK